jgi:hypothetical protein
MLRYIHADTLPAHPALARSMFRDRARQFRDRLGWAVTVDAAGEERDAYDALNPLYVIWQDAGGRHAGSMRFLPTTGQTMVNDHFRHLTGGVRIESPLIWECSRFCLAEGAPARVSAALKFSADQADAFDRQGREFDRGKTLLGQDLAELVEALTEAGVEVVSGDYEGRRRKDRRTLAILAPTNKAASVLRLRGVPATTIHRILYTPVYDPEYEKIAEWLAGNGSAPRSRG